MPKSFENEVHLWYYGLLFSSFNCLFPKTGFGYRGAFNWKILCKDCVNASQWTYLNLNWTACFLASFIPHYNQEEATWSGRLPCAFFQSLPSGIPLPQPIIMMPYSIHQNNPSVVPSTPKCQSKKKVPPNGRGENEIFEFTAWLRTLVQKRTIQVHQPIVGNGKKSHDRQLDTLLPEPKSTRYPENRQITVSRHSGLGRKWGSTRKKSIRTPVQVFWKMPRCTGTGK